MKRRLPLVLSALLTLSVIWALNTRIGLTPPLGKFLDPFAGVWQNTRDHLVPENQSLQLDGLRQEVIITYNQRGVPHIFAQNDHDLYMAMGYVQARHRLWQMEFSIMAASGRLSEVLGDMALGYDKHQRRIGMDFGAKRTVAIASQDSLVRTINDAYSSGVNAWIDQLDRKTLPVEYKLLDYSPDTWKNENTAYLLMNMNQTLTSRNAALSLTNVLATLGPELTETLFPDWNPRLEPIISTDREWDFEAQRRPSPSEVFIPQSIRTQLDQANESSSMAPYDPITGIGSNNWAVHGSRTASGAPLLATDPHLTLSLPAIWYEIQLSAPNVNAYGVTIPGAPAIVMGFNENVAWGNTNTGSKSLDLFEVRFSEDYREYYYDGEWRPITEQIESIRLRGGGVVTDTVRYTHHGPIPYMPWETSTARNIPEGYALSWIAFTPTLTERAFYNINRAANIEEIRNGLRYLTSLNQNYVAADRDGDIMMQLNGVHPIRWEGQGRYLLDGSSPAYDWHENIPFEHLPSEVSPPRGFVSSANQHPTNPSYPYYLGRFFALENRGEIINRVLGNLDQATYRDMIELQLNSEDNRAHIWLNEMLDSTRVWLEHAKIDPDHPDSLPTQITSDWIDRLSTWNRINEFDNRESTVFDNWLREVRVAMWTPLTKEPILTPITTPDLTVSIEMLFHRYHPEAYEALTGEMPQTSKLLGESLARALHRLERVHGPESEAWEWWRHNGSTVNHLMNIPAFNEPRLRVGGSSESPNAIRNHHGPSWRMVAELTTPVQAWGVYPGGQTGNPAISGYNAFIENWSVGEPFPLTLYPDMEKAQMESAGTLRLKPR